MNLYYFNPNNYGCEFFVAAEDLIKVQSAHEVLTEDELKRINKLNL